MKKNVLFIAMLFSVSLSAQIYTANSTVSATVAGNMNVGIGTNNPTEKLTIAGGHEDTSVLLSSSGNGSNQPATLALWASEPSVSYSGVGIGNNIKNYANGESFKIINPNNGGSYIFDYWIILLI